MLTKLAERLRPSIQSEEGSIRAQQTVETITILLLAPFAVIAFIWLLTVTDLDVLTENWVLMLLLAAMALGIKLQPFSMNLRLGSQSTIALTGSMMGVFVMVKRADFWGNGLLGLFNQCFYFWLISCFSTISGAARRILVTPQCADTRLWHNFINAGGFWDL